MLPPHIAGETFQRGAPLPPAHDGTRWQKLNIVAREIANKWAHPTGSSQYETETLHQVRAILYMNKSLITQSFVSHVSGVSQGSLSHYVRGLFRGNQQNVEDRLAAFVKKFAEGTLDKFLEEARSGSRPIGRPALFDQVHLSQQAQPVQSAGLPSNALQAAEIAADTHPPIAPPPPPQLQPAPWAKPPPPTPPLLPPGVTLDKAPEKSKSEGDASPEAVKPTEASYKMTDRARRAHQRQAAQQKKHKHSKRPRPTFPSMPEETTPLTPVVAVERAYHELVASRWSGESAGAEPLLIPIELLITIHDKTLHMYTQWDVNECNLSPEYVSERIRCARGLPEEFAAPMAMQIRRSLFDAGIICPPPPSEKDSENRRLIKIVVELEEGGATHVLRDEFEWDLGAGCMNSPEVFAQHLCTDANLSQRHAPAVAFAIRRQVVRAQAIAYGDEETKRLALNGLPPDDSLREPLSPVTSSLEKCEPEDQQLRDREENEIAIRNLFVKPILDSLPELVQKRREDRAKKAASEKAKKELEVIRRKESEELAKENAKLEKILKQVDDAATRLYEERNLDFRPYLELRVGRGERPSLWTPAAFDRRRRKQLTFPMTQQHKRKNQLALGASRSGKRKRTPSKREELAEEQKRQRGEDYAPGTNQSKKEIKTEDLRNAMYESSKKIFVKLRIRPRSRT